MHPISEKSLKKDRDLAQLVAHTSGGREVAGSSPVIPTERESKPLFISSLDFFNASIMLYVCYMFGKHVTCHKASGYRGLRPVMLEGYMFFLIAKGGCERRDAVLALASDFVDDRVIHLARENRGL